MRYDLAKILAYVFLVLFLRQASTTETGRSGPHEEPALPSLEEKLFHPGISPFQHVFSVFNPTCEPDRDEGRVHPVIEHVAEILKEELPVLIAALLNSVNPGDLAAIEEAELYGEMALLPQGYIPDLELERQRTELFPIGLDSQAPLINSGALPGGTTTSTQRG